MVLCAFITAPLTWILGGDGLSAWLHGNVGWLPMFGSGGPYGKSVLLEGAQPEHGQRRLEDFLRACMLAAAPACGLVYTRHGFACRRERVALFAACGHKFSINN